MCDGGMANGLAFDRSMAGILICGEGRARTINKNMLNTLIKLPD